MNAATRGKQPSVTPATGDIRLHAKDARIHANKMRYEPEPHKNVLGYWTNADDWAEWDFEVAEAGEYEIEVQQGCGKGSGGAKVAIEIGGQTLEFTVQETGHFQHMIQRIIGEVHLTPGKHTLAVKPQFETGRGRHGPAARGAATAHSSVDIPSLSCRPDRLDQIVTKFGEDLIHLIRLVGVPFVCTGIEFQPVDHRYCHFEL